MELVNDFRVDVPVAEAWKVLTDVERLPLSYLARNCRRSRATSIAVW